MISKLCEFIVIIVLVIIAPISCAKNYMATFSMENGMLSAINGKNIDDDAFSLKESFPDSDTYHYDCDDRNDWSSGRRCNALWVNPLEKRILFKNRKLPGATRNATFKLFRISASFHRGSTTSTSQVSGCSISMYSPLAGGSESCTTSSMIKKGGNYNVWVRDIVYSYNLVLENPQDWESGVWYSDSPVHFIQKNCRSGSCSGVFTDETYSGKTTPLNTNKYMSFVIAVEPNIKLDLYTDKVTLVQGQAPAGQVAFKGGAKFKLESNLKYLSAKIICGSGLEVVGNKCFVPNTEHRANLTTFLKVKNTSQLVPHNQSVLLRGVDGVNTGELKFKVQGDSNAFKDNEYHHTLTLEIRPWLYQVSHHNN